MEIFSYADRTSSRVITGDKVMTVYTPQAPATSEPQRDIGLRLSLADLPPHQPVNGQRRYASWTIDLPARTADGKVRSTSTLLQKVRDSAADYLPLTRANIVRQAFKFLGERYGWGHAFNARDCSGFISDGFAPDVQRSMGLVLPPNSAAPRLSPAFHHQLFTCADAHQSRLEAVQAADVGELIVVPGHVMMVLGRIDGQPYVIQDVPQVILRDPKGRLRKTKVNEVSVTPLLPLLFDEPRSHVDAMTSLVHATAR